METLNTLYNLMGLVYSLVTLVVMTPLSLELGKRRSKSADSLAEQTL